MQEVQRLPVHIRSDCHALFLDTKVVQVCGPVTSHQFGVRKLTKPRGSVFQVAGYGNTAPGKNRLPHTDCILNLFRFYRRVNSTRIHDIDVFLVTNRRLKASPCVRTGCWVDAEGARQGPFRAHISDSEYMFEPASVQFIQAQHSLAFRIIAEMRISSYMSAPQPW